MHQKNAYDIGSLLFSLGCLPLLFLAKLPSVTLHYILFIMLISFVAIYVMTHHQILKLSALFLVGLLWSTNEASQYLASVEPYIDQRISIEGTVQSLNLGQQMNHEQQSHRVHFAIYSIDQKKLSYPLSISLIWQDTALPSFGEVWRIKVKTKVVHGYLNEGGFDNQRFAIATRHLLTGTVEDANRLENTSSFRQNILDKSLPYFNLFSYGDIMLALTFGERVQLTEYHKTVMFETGIAHLMAISGMHIILVFYIGFNIIRGLQFFLPIKLMHYWLPLLSGFCVAIFYAWLSGFNPPALRALFALSLWLVFKYKMVLISSWQMINRIIALLLFFDPLMILSESFWLSCYVVICLIFINQWLSTSKRATKKYHYFIQLFKLQFFLTLLLLPIQLFIFKGTSGVAIMTNLVAIPTISFIVLPASLSMLVMSFFDLASISIILGMIAEQSLCWLFVVISLFSGHWIDISYQFYLMSSIGWFLFITWRIGCWHRYSLSIVITLMCMVTPIIKLPQEKWRIDMLDVGHGLAIVISKGRSAILYDTGAKWLNSSAAERIIIPFLKWHNLNVDGIIISHEHNDHIGGLNVIKKAFPNAWLMSSSTKLSNDHDCISGAQILWQELQLSVLWPTEMVNSAYNAQSCVIKLSDGRYSFLLTGDLEKAQEEKLVLLQKNNLFSTILQIPHHGSNTSSYYAFLAHVNPAIAIGSVARYNPWKLPSVKALKRYNKLEIDNYLTHQSGQISISIYTDRFMIERYRNEIKPRWYHDWFGTLPNYE